MIDRCDLQSLRGGEPDATDGCEKVEPLRVDAAV